MIARQNNSTAHPKIQTVELASLPSMMIVLRRTVRASALNRQYTPTPASRRRLWRAVTHWKRVWDRDGDVIAFTRQAANSSRLSNLEA